MEENGLICETFFMCELTSIIMIFRDIKLLSYCIYLFATGPNFNEISCCKTRDPADFNDKKYDSSYSWSHYNPRWQVSDTFSDVTSP